MSDAARRATPGMATWARQPNSLARSLPGSAITPAPHAVNSPNTSPLSANPPPPSAGNRARRKGVDDPGVPPCVAELYNPATGTWAQDGQAGASAQRDFSATLLNNGQVLFSGGLNGVYPAKVHVQATATLFDPATATSTSTGSMSTPRAFHTLTVLPNGQVLAAGGETQNNVGKFSITASAELYTP